MLNLNPDQIYVMKTILIIFMISLSSIALRAEESRLTIAQVETIVNLIATEIYDSKDLTVNTPTYDKKSGIWSGVTTNGVPHAGFLYNIRDKDAHYQIVFSNGDGANKEFMIHPSIRRRIGLILEKKN